jgi:CHAD domain-containing protein
LARADAIDGLAVDATTLTAARQLIPHYLEEVYAHAPAVHDPTAARQHHQLRIAAKRLRYVMENFAFLSPAEFEPLIDSVRQIQDLLGKVRDSDVFVAFFEGYLVDRRRDAEAALSRAAFAGSTPPARPSLEGLRSAVALDESRAEREAVLRLIERTRARRRAAFAEFQTLWEKLTEGGFHPRVLAAIGADPRDTHYRPDP